MKHLFRTAFLPVILIPSLIVSPIWAQTSPQFSSTAITSSAGTLELKVVNPDGSKPSNLHANQALTVQVRDTNGAGVPDAAVAFRLPDTGLSGVFADGSHSAVAYTDTAGMAHVEGIRWSAVSGSVSIRITASKGNSHAGILLEQPMADTAGRTPVINAEANPPTVKSNVTTPGSTIATGNTVAPSPALAEATTPAARTPGLLAAPVASSAIRPTERPSISISNTSSSGSVRSNSLAPDAEPSVSISNSSGGYSNHAGLKKWLIWTAVIAAGAGAGIAFAGRSSISSSSSSSSSGTTIGTPSISIGH